ncbi:nuclear transport factor 2 family protein [Moraxella oblonga]|uniref:nuclear transport factor 2 family protein n=1 Tax=Moraxella oblonga TaxID=200413 RepID=UPI000A01ABF0|nr:nuclear transport factor 2 family protein [Moraxella oblonga]
MKALILSLVLASVALTGCQTVSNVANPAKASVSTAQSKTERNKANAIAFYEMAFNQHKVAEATAKYVGDTYLQHNPTVADGGQAFIDAFVPFLKQHPKSSAKIHRVIAEGDLVVLHVHSRLDENDKGEAVVDIFRFDDNGKIVEHWDTIQAIPEKTVSGRTMF